MRWRSRVGAVTLGLVVLAAKPALGDTVPAGEGKAATQAKPGEAKLSASGAKALAEARRLHSAAQKLFEQGRTGEAIELSQRAVAVTEAGFGAEHPEVANSLNDLAFLYKMNRDYAKAEPLFQRALAIWAKAHGSEHLDVARVLSRLAGLYEAKGDYAKAEPLYQRAIGIREKVLGPEHPDVATALNSLAALYHSQRYYAKAEPLYKRALFIREKALGPEHLDVAQSLRGLGQCYMARFDFVASEPLLRRALAVTERILGPEHRAVANALGSLASLYGTKKDYVKAEPLLQRALSIREKALGPDHPSVASALMGVGEVFMAKGDYIRAEAAWQRALSIREKTLGLDHPSVVHPLMRLAVLYQANGDDVRAEPLLDRAVRISGRISGPEHPVWGAVLNRRALLYVAAGDYAKAEPLYRRALSINEKVLGLHHPLVAIDHWNLASLSLELGSTSGATQSLERAIAIEDRNAAVMLYTGSDEQKRAYMTRLRQSTDSAVAWHVQYAPDARAAKQLAVKTILRRKGRILDSISDSFAALRRNLKPADKVLLGKLQSVSTRYSALVWRGPAEMPLGQYRTTLDQLDEERQSIEGELSLRSAELRAASQPVTIDQVREAIPEGVALVELFQYLPPRLRPSSPKSKPRYVAYVLYHRENSSFVDLGEAAPIDAAAQKFRAALGDPDLTHDPKPVARALDALVMQPIRKLLGHTRGVFLSPDGALNLVPFAALVDEDGRYLVERYSFTYLPSGRDLLRFAVSAKPRQPSLVLANPAFDSIDAHSAGEQDENRRGLRSVDMSLVRFSPLPSTTQEALAIQDQLAAAVLVGPQATEGAVKAVHGPRILHIASHGFFLPEQDEPRTDPEGHVLHPENPLLRSGLGLAGANVRASGANDDGILTALEVSGLDLYGTKLVVLSACETGVGTVRSGEGVYGLRRALVIAGTETQVMSLWKVDTGVTRDMMVAYYDKIERGAGRSEAMRQVQLEMLGQPDRAHPNLWASFIVSGNPAALDGRLVTPDFARVAPGMRGCACHHAGDEGDTHRADVLALAALVVLAAARVLAATRAVRPARDATGQRGDHGRLHFERYRDARAAVACRATKRPREGASSIPTGGNLLSHW